MWGCNDCISFHWKCHIGSLGCRIWVWQRVLAGNADLVIYWVLVEALEMSEISQQGLDFGKYSCFWDGKGKEKARREIRGRWDPGEHCLKRKKRRHGQKRAWHKQRHEKCVERFTTGKCSLRVHPWVRTLEDHSWPMKVQGQKPHYKWFGRDCMMWKQRQDS